LEASGPRLIGLPIDVAAIAALAGVDRAWLSSTVQEALGKLIGDECELVRLAFYEDFTQGSTQAEGLTSRCRKVTDAEVVIVS
jgi:hypothetical protein